MEYKIKEFIYSFFRSVPDCAQMRALRMEITRNMIQRYYNYINSGKTPGEAYDAILGCAQEMKDRIAEALRNVHVEHTAPPFGSSRHTTRTYTAYNQSTQTKTKQNGAANAKRNPSNSQAKKHNTSHIYHQDSHTSKPSKKPISPLTAVFCVLLGVFLLAAVAYTMFWVTQAAFSSLQDNSQVENPIPVPDSAQFSEDEADGSLWETDAVSTLTLGDLAQTYRDVTQSFSEDGAYAIDAEHLGSVAMLEVHWPAGNIEIDIYDGEDFLAVESCDNGTITQTQALCCGLEGNVLFIQYCTPQAADSTLPIKNLQIYIPETLANTAITGSFSIYQANLSLNGLTFTSAQIAATDGSITTQNLNVSELLSVETSSSNAALSGVLKTVQFSSQEGSLELDSSASLCSVEAQTQSGNVDIYANLHRLRTSTYGGDLHIHTPICPYELDLASRSGNIFLNLPAQSDFTLNFQSDSGHFLSGLSVVQARGNYIRGDGIANFSVETLSGDLKIYTYTANSES